MSDRNQPDASQFDSDEAELVPRDKLFEHHRRQLSAMLDGELPPDQAKFMLRRLQHDGELAACWERWQVGGDILRGRHDLLLPADFSQRVRASIAAGAAGSVAPTAPAPVSAPSGTASSSPRWLRWGGGAIAASVALVALMFARAPNGPGLVDPAEDAAATRVTSLVSAGSGAPASTPDEAPVVLARADVTTTTEAQAPASPDSDLAAGQAAALAAAGVAVASVPRRANGRDARSSTRSQAQRAGVRLRSAEPSAPQYAAAGAAPSTLPLDARGAAPVIGVAAAASASGDPFAAQPVAPTRPWPRAILPGYASGGTFNASYSGGSAAFHPFEPTTPAVPAPIEREPVDASPATTGPR